MNLKRAAELLHQVSDASRIRILLMLQQETRHVGSMCEELALHQPAVSHHLTLLRASGLAESTHRGSQNHYSLTDLGRLLLTAIGPVLGPAEAAPKPPAKPKKSPSKPSKKARKPKVATVGEGVADVAT